MTGKVTEEKVAKIYDPMDHCCKVLFILLVLTRVGLKWRALYTL